MKKIFLVGFMGSGKTTVGRMLADLLKCDFLDLDDLIVKRAGRSIPEIFASEGEAHFRSIERDELKALAERERIVAALGGGAFVSAENRAAVREQGTSVWLDCALDTIIYRLGNDRSRPLYAGRSREDLTALYESRKPAYKQADLRIDVTDLDPSQAVEKLIQLCRNLWGEL